MGEGEWKLWKHSGLPVNYSGPKQYILLVSSQGAACREAATGSTDTSSFDGTTNKTYMKQKLSLPSQLLLLISSPLPSIAADWRRRQEEGAGGLGGWEVGKMNIVLVKWNNKAAFCINLYFSHRENVSAAN